jgi:hypothetical protein
MSTTTTNGPAPRPEPRIRLSGLEWRLCLTTLLSGTYVIAWIAFAMRAPETATTATPFKAEPPVAAKASSRFVWLTDLPPADRPPVSLPPGWVIAGASTPARPELIRRPATANFRIRTRTS